MGHIYNSVEEMIGHTPLLRLHRIEEKFGIKAKLYAKIEFMNPGGSIKDRTAKQMLDEAEKEGKINKDTIIVEPTSGNTGIGLALLAAARGYRAIIVMPDSMSKERIQLMKAYGAEVVLTPGRRGMNGAIVKASTLAMQSGNGFIPSQFTNPANPMAHVNTTGPEIWDDLEGDVDILVATFGTGGTISGTAAYLKSKKSDVEVIGIEPESSPLLTKGTAGPHKIQGIGANFIPEILDTEIIDRVETVSDDDAYEYTRILAKTEGVLAGISSGAALAKLIEVSKRPENEGKSIVTIFTDTGERYLSSGVFEE